MKQDTHTTTSADAADMVVEAIEAGDASASEYDVDQIVRDAFDYDVDAQALVQTVDEDDFWDVVAANALPVFAQTYFTPEQAWHSVVESIAIKRDLDGEVSDSYDVDQIVADCFRVRVDQFVSVAYDADFWEAVEANRIEKEEAKEAGEFGQVFADTVDIDYTTADNSYSWKSKIVQVAYKAWDTDETGTFVRFEQDRSSDDVAIVNRKGETLIIGGTPDEAGTTCVTEMKWENEEWVFVTQDPLTEWDLAEILLQWTR